MGHPVEDCLSGTLQMFFLRLFEIFTEKILALFSDYRLFSIKITDKDIILFVNIFCVVSRIVI